MKSRAQDNEFYLLLAVPVLLLFFGPQLWAQAQTWLVAHRVLVPSHSAAITLPRTSLGLDAVHLQIALCLTVALVAGLTSLHLHRKIQTS